MALDSIAEVKNILQDLSEEGETSRLSSIINLAVKSAIIPFGSSLLRFCAKQHKERAKPVLKLPAKPECKQWVRV